VSDTPRTDALYFPNGVDATTVFMPHFDLCLEHARQLERELADLKIKMAGSSREYEELLAEARKDSERLKWIFDNIMYLPMDNGTFLPEMSRAALDAARTP